jgi:hypothetical protein
MSLTMESFSLLPFYVCERRDGAKLSLSNKDCFSVLTEMIMSVPIDCGFKMELLGFVTSMVESAARLEAAVDLLQEVHSEYVHLHSSDVWYLSQKFLQYHVRHMWRAGRLQD